jgi:Uma2 family endonuclease
MAIERAETERVPSVAGTQPAGPTPRLFTVDEYYKMAEVGILRPDERVQLIEGMIIQMPPGGPDHSSSVDWMAELFRTLRFDLGEKAAMSARHGVADLWVVDLQGDRVVAHREPTPNGYAEVRRLTHGKSISPLAFEDVVFSVDEILG